MIRAALTLVLSRRLSRQEAFSAQGVTLASFNRSWSGVRDDDGSVVFALLDTDIQPCSDGFRCLLWSPLMASAGSRPQGGGRGERLEHCLVALTRGGADGFIVGGASAEVERNCVLTLQVRQQRGEYWAVWGLAPSESGCFDSPRSLLPAHAALAAMAA